MQDGVGDADLPDIVKERPIADHRCLVWGQPECDREPSGVPLTASEVAFGIGILGFDGGGA